MTGARTRHLIVLLGVLALMPGVVHAQAVSVSGTCSEGWSTLGALGITEFNCDCTFDREVDPAWRFRGEPPDGVRSHSICEGDASQVDYCRERHSDEAMVTVLRLAGQAPEDGL